MAIAGKDIYRMYATPTSQALNAVLRAGIKWVLNTRVFLENRTGCMGLTAATAMQGNGQWLFTRMNVFPMKKFIPTRSVTARDVPQ